MGFQAWNLRSSPPFKRKRDGISVPFCICLFYDPDRTRTCNQTIKSRLLCQLSYGAARGVLYPKGHESQSYSETWFRIDSRLEKCIAQYILETTSLTSVDELWADSFPILGYIDCDLVLWKDYFFAVTAQDWFHSSQYPGVILFSKRIIAAQQPVA